MHLVPTELRSRMSYAWPQVLEVPWQTPHTCVQPQHLYIQTVIVARFGIPHYAGHAA